MKGPYALLGGAEGFAECSLSGVEPAAFFNRCAAAGIRLWDVEPVDETRTDLTLSLRALRRAKQIAGRSQCELTERRLSGAGLLFRRLLRRGTLVLGLLGACALLCWSRLFIWEIEVTGNETVSAGAIRGALSDCGVGLGTFWPDLVSDNLRSELLVRLPRLAWATVNVRGSRAEVIVRERVEKPELLDEDERADLVAKRLGFVTQVRALSGTALVRPGSAVMPGDVLISGQADSAFAGSRETHAIGTVTAETYYELNAAAPVLETRRAASGAGKSRWSLLIGKKRVNFYRNSSFCPPDCDKIVSTWECKIEGLFSLPLALRREKSEAYRCEERERDLSALRREMEQQLHERLLAEADGGTIEQETWSCAETDGRLVVALRARCSENIAKERKK